jgi:hypothetical protein
MKIPKTLKDIKLKQLIEIDSIDKELPEQEYRLNEIAILCNTTFDELYNSDINKLKNIFNDINWFYKLEPELVEPVLEFKYDNINYKMISEMEQLKFGQWIDLDVYIQIHKDNYWMLTKYIIALCSSIKDKENSYPSTEVELNKRINIIEDLTLDIIFGYTSYFFNKKKRWNNLSQMYLTLSSQQQSTQNSIQTTASDMGGIYQLFNYVGIILAYLIMFLGWIYINVFLSCQSKIQNLLLRVRSIKLWKLNIKNK